MPIGQLGAYEAIWHTDMSYIDEPPSASALYSLEVAALGRRYRLLQYVSRL